MKAIAVNPSFEISSNETYVEGLNGRRIFSFSTGKNLTVSLQLEAIEDNGTLFNIIKPKKWYKASYEDDINDNRDRRGEQDE